MVHRKLTRCLLLCLLQASASIESSTALAAHISGTDIPLAPYSLSFAQDSAPPFTGQPAIAAVPSTSTAALASPATALPALAVNAAQPGAAAGAVIGAAPVSGIYALAGLATARPTAAAAAGVPSSSGGAFSIQGGSGSMVATGTRAAAQAVGPPPRVTSARPGRGLANLFSSPSVFLSRAMTPSLCRYESMDALQHLSPEGFIHSWLPSYSNPSKVSERRQVKGACYMR